MSVVRVGLLGLGTVGSGVVKTIRSQEKKLVDRLGRKVEIVKALVRDVNKERQVEIDRCLLTTDFADILAADVDIVVEVMGGVEPTYGYLRQAIERGCHIVTANKELLAKRGRELIDLANRHEVHLFYEASVAGGIPILSVIRQFLRTNDITAIQGILNGTTNYILTQMEQHQRSYEDVLKEAQDLGYAEMDPTSDVEGFDPLYKLYILSQLVFGESQTLDSIDREGITQLSSTEIQFAKELGYRVKLLARAEKTQSGVRLSVKPTLLSLGHSLAGIQDAYNAVQLTGNVVGDLMFTGRGAGELPTGSAVVEDLAYLLTQPFIPQPSWGQDREPAVARVVSSGGGKSFVYLETAKSEYTLNEVFGLFDSEKVSIRKLKTQYVEGEVLRIGLVVHGFSSRHLELLRNLQLQVKQYAIIEGAEETDDELSLTDAHEELLLKEAL